MGVEALDSYMYCNTSEVHFGPEFKDDTECEKFIHWIFKTQKEDPRGIPVPRLVELKAEWDVVTIDLNPGIGCVLMLDEPDCCLGLTVVKWARSFIRMRGTREQWGNLLTDCVYRASGAWDQPPSYTRSAKVAVTRITKALEK